MIVSGSASQALAAALAAELGEPLAMSATEHFPDGELLASVGDFDAERAIIVSSTVSSDAHVELLQLQDAAREAGATEIVTVIPYMGYGRQDQSFKPGQPVSARAMARAISTGTDRVITVNPHEQLLCDFFSVPCTSVDAAPQLANALPADLENPVFLAPDEGAIDLAASVRDAHGTGDTDYFVKKRLSGSEVDITPSDTDVSGRDVVLVDDIIATGSTMSESIEILQGRSPNRVFVTCVHPMLASNAQTKLARVGVEAIYGTDTIERAVSSVTVAPAIAEALEN
ncbi:ribose-phosphate diphosphokinase [Haladaptatus sp. DJG-WS-42]|uniref:ribose-phosphate diphosphokinase n=1 Tax=Haladaptatus sp. DJG-WS-42 TaxID=3120516 RepID=UPI0030CBAFF7